MSFELKQRYFFITRSFELTDNTVKIRIKKPGSLITDEFKYEDISLKTATVKDFPLIYFLFFLVAICSFTVCLMSRLSGDASFEWDEICGLFMLTCFTAYICLGRYSNNLNLFLLDGRAIVFFAASPSAPDVERFLENLRTAQKKHLLNKYARSDEFTSPERIITQLKWLHDHGFISTNELHSLKNRTMINSYIPEGLTFNPNLN